MALKDVFEETPGGLVAGIGALILAPVLVPALAKVGKPLAKAAIKRGILLYERSKGVLAEAGETLEDLVAEAQAELATEVVPTEESQQNPESHSAETLPEAP